MNQVQVKENRTYYNQFSQIYENPRHEGYHKLIDDLESEIIQEFTGGGEILEVGCGTGLILERIGRFAKKAVGIDLSEKMLEKAQVKGLKVLQSSAVALPFKNESFDLTCSFKVLSHIRDIHIAMGEMARVTKRQGIVMAEFYNAQSFRGFRWFLRKTFFSKSKHPGHITEKDIYTAYLTVDEMKKTIPPGLQLIDIRGVVMWTPFAFFHKIPGVASFLNFLESTSTRSRSFRFSGFVILILRKE